MVFTEHWKNHKNADLIQLIPTEWIKKFRNTEASEIGETLGHKKINNLDSFYSHLLLEGLYEPLKMIVDFVPNMKLEEGNHRIQVAMKYNIKYMPLIVEVVDDCEQVTKNGKHLYNAFNEIIRTPPVGLYKPTDIFVNIKSFDIKDNG